MQSLNLSDSVSQFSHTMTAQADLRVEAEHLRRFYRNFATVSSSVHVPQPIAGERRQGAVLPARQPPAARHLAASSATAVWCGAAPRPAWCLAWLDRRHAHPPNLSCSPPPPLITGYCTEAVLVESYEPGQSVSTFIQNPHPQNTQVGAQDSGTSAYAPTRSLPTAVAPGSCQAGCWVAASAALGHWWCLLSCPRPAQAPP